MSATQSRDAVERRPEAAAIGLPRLTFRRVLRSEGIKLVTLRSTFVLLAATMLCLVGIGLIAALTASGAVTAPQGGASSTSDSPVSTVLTGANLAVLIVAVLGVMAGSREYASGLMRTTLAAVPSRLPVLWAKLGAFTLLALPVLLVGVVLAFSTGTAILSQASVASATWSDPGVVRAVLGTAGYLWGIGLIGICLGLLLRNTAAGISVLIGGILILPTLATALLPDSWGSVLKYLPSLAGTSFTSVTLGHDRLGAGSGAAIFATWVLAAALASALSLRRRDA